MPVTGDDGVEDFEHVPSGVVSGTNHAGNRHTNGDGELFDLVRVGHSDVEVFDELRDATPDGAFRVLNKGVGAPLIRRASASRVPLATVAS